MSSNKNYCHAKRCSSFVQGVHPGTESKTVCVLWLPHLSCKVMSWTSKANIIFWKRPKLQLIITIMYHVFYQFECATWCTMQYVYKDKIKWDTYLHREAKILTDIEMENLNRTITWKSQKTNSLMVFALEPTVNKPSKLWNCCWKSQVKLAHRWNEWKKVILFQCFESGEPNYSN